MRFATLVMSCRARADALGRTISRLRDTGWAEEPLVVLDDGVGEQAIDRIHRTWRRMIQTAAAAKAPFVLLLEDDLVFGTHFAHNLRSWRLLTALPEGRACYASLYNPGRPYLVRRPSERYFVADPRFVWGAQALVTTPETARYLDAHWESASGNPDQRMPRIVSRITSIYLHLPSLVNHEPVPTTWGGIEHVALDFDPEWRAPESA